MTLRQRRQAQRRRLSGFTNGPATRELSTPQEARGAVGLVLAAAVRGPEEPRWAAPAPIAVVQALPVPAALSAASGQTLAEPAAFGAVDAAAQAFSRSLTFSFQGVAND